MYLLSHAKRQKMTEFVKHQMHELSLLCHYINDYDLSRAHAPNSLALFPRTALFTPNLKVDMTP